MKLGLLTTVLAVTAVGCAHYRPAPPAELGTPVAVVQVGAALSWPRFDGVEVNDVTVGGWPFAENLSEGRDRLHGSLTTRFTLTEDDALLYRVACRTEFPEDQGGAGIEHVCAFEPARRDLAAMRLVLTAAIDAPLRGALFRADEVIVEIEGTSRLAKRPRSSRTTGVLLRDPVSADPLAFVTTTGTLDQAYLGSALGAEDRRALRPAILALVVARDLRNDLDGDERTGDVPSSPFRPAPSTYGAEVDEAELVELDDPEVQAFATRGYPSLARALARTKLQIDAWPDDPKDSAPVFGPDLRPEVNRAFVLIDALFALTMSSPLDTPGGPSFGWLIAVGVDLVDLVDVYGVMDLTPTHPLGDDVALDRSHTARLGLGTRINLIRFEPVRVFAGFEGGLTPMPARLSRGQTEVARWSGASFGPTAGARFRLGSRLGGGAADLRIEGTLMREIWTLDEDLVGGLSDRVERWTPGLRTILQIKL